jgi:UDP-glucuronate decarboxylase
MKNSNQLNIVVAGGAGFIGSHLCERLINYGNKVICLDNLSTGLMGNIKHLLDNENFYFFHWDICKSISLRDNYYFLNKYFLEEELTFSDINQIYNLACPASPLQYSKDPISTLKASTIGVYNILELIKNTNTSFLQASTSEIYGNPLEHPQKEIYTGNVNPVGERACYNEGKRCAEAFIINYTRKYNIDAKIARIFNTYGTKMKYDDGRVIPNFIKQALSDSPLTIHGNGNQTRCFMYIDDLIDGLIYLMNSNIKDPVNLGNTNEITILDLAKKIISMTNSQSEIIHFPMPEDDPLLRKPDISRAKKYLHWEPKISLQKGLEKTIEYFQKPLP